MQAGQLDRVITIRRSSSDERDVMNAPIVVWRNLATVRASRKDVSDAERVRAAQTGATVTSRFVIRRSEVPDLTALDRLVCDGRAFAIVGVKEAGSRFEAWEISGTAMMET